MLTLDYNLYWESMELNVKSHNSDFQFNDCVDISIVFFVYWKHTLKQEILTYICYRQNLKPQKVIQPTKKNIYQCVSLKPQK